jgi:hypothetical protein
MNEVYVRKGMYLDLYGIYTGEDQGRLDQGADVSDFTAGWGWGLGAGYFIEFEYVGFSLGLALERMSLDAKRGVLSPGSYRMTPFWMQGEMYFISPASPWECYGQLGLGAVFVGHTISDSAIAEYAAYGLSARETVMTGSGAKLKVGGRCRFTDWVSLDLGVSVMQSQHVVQYAVTDLATGDIDNYQNDMLGLSTLGTLGLRFRF